MQEANDVSLTGLLLAGQNLAAALGGNAVLTTLNLFGKAMGDEGAARLAEALATNATLESLFLQANKIGDAGAKALGEALRTNATLTELHCRKNQISDEGARWLERGPQANTALKRLRLDDNRIGKEGAVALGDALKTNATLHLLDLNGNQIGDEGAIALAEGLQSNSTLETLKISWHNQIGDSGATALGAALTKNTTLTELDLRDLQIGRDGMMSLIEAVRQHNVQLKSLHVQGNWHGAEQLVDNLMRRNKVLVRFVRKAIRFLIGVRQGSSINGMGDIGRVPKEVVLIIAKHVWATRGDPKWLEALRPPSNPTPQDADDREGKHCVMS